MFTFIFSFLLLLLLLFSTTTTTAQPYNATDHLRFACGSSSTADGWDGDEGSKFTLANIATNSFSSTPSYRYPSVPETPYSTARIFNGTSSFTYTFPVSEGPKFLRLYFYPATYSDLPANQSFFSVSSNGYTLLTNFSAFLAASYRPTPISLPVPYLVKEFIVYVKETQTLDVIFTPKPNSYAYINGIEIVSMPEHLYYKPSSFKYVGISDDMALESIYRLNMGGGYISGNADTGMYRSWKPDDDYIFGAAIGWTHFNTTPITYTMETPNYTAPEQVYMTQRSMGNMSDLYNLTWILPVDSGFYYMIRLHFCNIIRQYNTSGQMVFTIFINNRTVEEGADPLNWTQGSGHPVFKDYRVFVSDPDGRGSKQDLWLAMHPNFDVSTAYGDGYLNGLEAFKLSKAGNLSSPNPQLFLERVPNPELGHSPESPTKVNKKNTPYIAIIGGVGGGLVLLSTLVLNVLWRLKHRGCTTNQLKHCHSAFPSKRCRRFNLEEMKVSTCEFNDNFVIGNGGFGKVYKGYINNGTTTVAIKRLDPSSSQGFREFRTEIGMLSRLRHIHLVSLIGYCDDHGEMMLVYEYMANGTLRDHLYKTNNPHLSWKSRLRICIGAAKGLHYLHTGANRKIIHRDVKSTNILLDENWVAKVSDFGLSKLGPKDPSKTHVSTFVKGSIGYLDPEYCRRQRLTEKSDVYSFGVVLFEVLCARPVIMPWLPNEQVSVAEWGRYCYRKGTLEELVDPKVKGEIVGGSLRKFGEVANSCLKEEGSDRPSMEAVVYGLEFALMLQEADERLNNDAMSNNQEESATRLIE